MVRQVRDSFVGNLYEGDCFYHITDSFEARFQELVDECAQIDMPVAPIDRTRLLRSFAVAHVVVARTAAGDVCTERVPDRKRFIWYASEVYPCEYTDSFDFFMEMAAEAKRMRETYEKHVSERKAKPKSKKMNKPEELIDRTLVAQR